MIRHHPTLVCAFQHIFRGRPQLWPLLASVLIGQTNGVMMMYGGVLSTVVTILLHQRHIATLFVIKYFVKPDGQILPGRPQEAECLESSVDGS